MSEKVVSSRAKWVLPELIPVVLMLGLGLLSIVLGVTEVFTIEGAFILGIPTFALFAFLVFENLKRKKRSTLHARLSNDDKYNIAVWMTRPNKDKWKGRLDINGKNKGALVDTKQIVLEDVQGTPVVVFKQNKNERITVPARIIEDRDEVREYILDAISKIGNVSFATPVDKKGFEALIIGEGFKSSQLKNEKIISEPSKEWSKDSKVERPDYSSLSDSSDTALDDAVSDSEAVKGNEQVVLPKANIQATQVIGYGQYNKKTTDDIISEALSKAEAKLDAEAAKDNNWDSIQIPNQKD